MAQLTCEEIYVTDEKSILFIKMRTGWYWGLIGPRDGSQVFPPMPEKFNGPKDTYPEARIDAWRKEIEGKVYTTYIQEVGYAWSKQIASRPPIA